jgi:hypothetical protein
MNRDKANILERRRIETKADTLLCILTFKNANNTVQFIHSLKALGDEFDVLVVDDYSGDGTPEIMRRAGLHVVTTDGVLGLVQSLNLAYRVFKKGHHQGLYTNMIIANMRASLSFDGLPQILVGEGGIDMTRASLLQHPFVVPMSTLQGVRDNPLQSIEAVHKLDQSESTYVNECANHKRVQAGLTARATESAMAFTPAPKLDSFWIAFRAPDIFSAELTPNVLFSSPGHDDLVGRLTRQGMPPMISHDTFVFHIKSAVARPKTHGLASSVVVALAISDPRHTAEMVDSISAELGWAVRILLITDLYDLQGVDVLITDLSEYDLTKVANEKPTIIKVFWSFVGIEHLTSWVETQAFGLYDLVLSVSEEEKQHLDEKQPFELKQYQIEKFLVTFD